MSKYTQTVEITAESQNHVESFIHEIKKQSDEASRYGVTVEVRRVQEESNHTEGFDE